jgi:Uma2 family endonuclease
MAINQTLYTVEAFEAFAALPENRDRLLELVYGEIHEKVPTEKHGILTGIFFMVLMLFAESRKLGYPSIETRHHLPNDAHNARLPDVSFRRATSPVVEQGAVQQMPDLAIEIQSPDDSPREMREKAAYYLQNGTEIVWLVYLKQTVEVCTRSASGSIEFETVDVNGTLSGGNVLPGFTLALKDVFLRDVWASSEQNKG